VFRNFPLSEVHPHAEAAAESAETANDLGGVETYWEMHDMLFDNQEALEEDDLVQYAISVGLDAHDFTEALESGEFSKRVRKDFMSGVRSGVNGTPTFFVNGERYDGDWTDVDEFASALTAGSPSP
jgi:protein-disulfide isomerase